MLLSYNIIAVVYDVEKETNNNNKNDQWKINEWQCYTSATFYNIKKYFYIWKIRLNYVYAKLNEDSKISPSIHWSEILLVFFKSCLRYFWIWSSTNAT